MKKLLLLSTMLLVALVANAQVKVAPKMKKGDKKVYVVEVQTTLPNQNVVKMTSESQYVVEEENAEGYVMSVVITDVQTDAPADDLSGRVLSIGNQLMLNTKLRFLADKDGKPIKILNYDEVINNVKTTVDTLLDEIVKSVPSSDASQIKTLKDLLTKQVMERFSEETMLELLQANSSPMSLNGKTISTGAQDEFTSEMGLKMKRIYFVNADGSILTSSVVNMTKEEMKKMIIDAVKELAPEQAEMVKQNIDMVMESGMMKMESSEKSTYTFGADGWVDSIKCESENNSMGQKTTSVSVCTLKK